MSYAHIYSPSKTAMQSGKAKTGYWILEYCNPDQKFYDPVMGWTGSLTTENQVRLQFDTFQEALAFCSTLGLEPVMDPEPTQKPFVKKAYADNFRANKPPLN